MFKSIIKETFIMLLLCVAIVLVLGIIFYDYIPTNQVVPKKETYSTPEEVKEEIEENIVELNNEVIKYEVTGSDLNLYKQNKSYKPGKRDPFSPPNQSSKPSTNTTNDVGDGTNSDNNNDTIPTNTDPNSTGTFFNDEGIK